ncbi:GDSL-like Lipase/Acylhydrolase [Pseudovirgaria hyperparasitica]|uniref:GDSL-like Lipase/Acylhydrolase n=1 Tax=Pseudovirgaria hyperparasitica TaxID=470096 RepID=A0A6A6WI54_9PEZI|nr:GDSL-like Lipase/Acylhydrolase [Pseudovirgaria hyperparasitica]KAF2760831.1 GDSL-like Lipase/Acylhydrolase [Pseudovirgaria hyperparasitica]
MQFSSLISLSLVPLSHAIPVIYIAGDSTTAPDGGHNGTQGWGEYLQYSFSANTRVNNSAYAGRSARSFTREGRFAAIAEALVPGDWVIIEFGINDAGIPQNGSTSTTGDKGRVDCPGSGEEVCVVTYNNVTEYVQTFGTYVKNASRLFLEKGAKLVISERLPTNSWQTGEFKFTPSVYAYYSMLVTQELGGPKAGVYFVQHGQYAAQAQKLLGKDIVKANYPMDNTHPAPYLADIFHQAFVLGLKCGTSPLADLIVNATARIEGPLLGTCIQANATLPI